MNRKQSAILIKGKRLLAVFLKFILIVNGILKLKAAVAELKVHVTAADKCKNEQIKSIKGYAIEKKDFKDNGVRLGKIISGLIYLYAIDIGDKVLAEEMKLVKSDIDVKDEICSGVLQNIKEYATTYKTELEDYGLISDMYDEFVLNADGFAAHVTDPQNAIGEHHVETSGLETALNNIDSVVNIRLERLMASMESINPAFYSEYDSANKDTILGSNKKRTPTTIEGSFKIVLRNKVTLDLIAEGLVKVVGDDETYYATKFGTDTIYAELGPQIIKATTLDYLLATATINVTEVEQTIEILMEPCV